MYLLNKTEEHFSKAISRHNYKEGRQYLLTLPPDGVGSNTSPSPVFGGYQEPIIPGHSPLFLYDTVANKCDKLKKRAHMVDLSSN